MSKPCDEIQRGGWAAVRHRGGLVRFASTDGSELDISSALVAKTWVLVALSGTYACGGTEPDQRQLLLQVDDN